MGWPPAAWRRWVVVVVVVAALTAVAATAVEEGGREKGVVAAAQGRWPRHRHAYAAMMYMGTPRDYEFYVAVRVMMRSLARIGADADRVLIASADVPADWETREASEASRLYYPCCAVLICSKSKQLASVVVE
uniref:Uncharacterized protein n=1 Tax=Oryza punctata TaxID=4537 RepID=A0A0E0MAK8_ORYPU